MRIMDGKNGATAHKASAENPWTAVERLPCLRALRREWRMDFHLWLYTFLLSALCCLIEGSIVSRLKESDSCSCVAQTQLPVCAKSNRRALINTQRAMNTWHILLYIYSYFLHVSAASLPSDYYKALNIFKCICIDKKFYHFVAVGRIQGYLLTILKIASPLSW